MKNKNTIILIIFILIVLVSGCAYYILNQSDNGGEEKNKLEQNLSTQSIRIKEIYSILQGDWQLYQNPERVIHINEDIITYHNNGEKSDEYKIKISDKLENPMFGLERFTTEPNEGDLFMEEIDMQTGEVVWQYHFIGNINKDQFILYPLWTVSGGVLSYSKLGKGKLVEDSIDTSIKTDTYNDGEFGLYVDENKNFSILLLEENYPSLKCSVLVTGTIDNKSNVDATFYQEGESLQTTKGYVYFDLREYGTLEFSIKDRMACQGTDEFKLGAFKDGNGDIHLNKYAVILTKEAKLYSHSENLSLFNFENLEFQKNINKGQIVEILETKNDYSYIKPIREDEAYWVFNDDLNKEVR